VSQILGPPHDSIDRVQKVETLYPNGTAIGAYTRYEYPNSMTVVKTFSKLQAGDEAESFSVLDGTGNVRATASELPGSTGGWSGQLFLYDNMGRKWKSSTASETSASGAAGTWTTVGDDATTGWLYTSSTFDWKGRILVVTNTDGTTKEFLYDGCGCAGGEIIISRDEVGRRFKGIYDSTGRFSKAIVLNQQPKTEPINGNGDPYSTTVNTYNARDQITNVKVYQGVETTDGLCPTGTCQETISIFDGHGRLWKTHAPEQDNTPQLKYTIRTYNTDDTLQSMTDARNAKSSYSYNNRKLLLGIIYDPQNSGVQDTPDVSFSYDAVGNRKSMTDGFGMATYTYNSLSRLISESREISELGQTYTRNYDYNLAGQLTAINDPNNTNLNISYDYDKTGHLTSVNSGGYGGVNLLANGFKYRAWGALKHIDYNNGLKLDLEYNNRLQMNKYELKNPNANQILLGQTYRYTTTTSSTDNDGRLKFSHEYFHDLPNNNLDRTYIYNDPIGRLTASYAGEQNTVIGYTYYTGPFEHLYTRDAFGQLTGRSWRVFETISTPPGTITRPVTQSYTDSYTNNRNTAPGWVYDADGRLLTSQNSTGSSSYIVNYVYDVDGQMISVTAPNKNISQAFDGNGSRMKFVENGDVTYYLRSSVLNGQTLVELNSSGGIKRSYVYANGSVIAKQENNQVLWDHQDPSGVSTRLTNASGQVTSKVEMDPLSVQVSDSPDYNYGGSVGYIANPNGFYGTPTLPDMGCYMDGVPAPCNMVQSALRQGTATQCPDNRCGPRTIYGHDGDYNPDGTPKIVGALTLPFMYFANGIAGFPLPFSAGAGTPQDQAELGSLALSMAIAGITPDQLGAVASGEFRFSEKTFQDFSLDELFKYFRTRHADPMDRRDENHPNGRKGTATPCAVMAAWAQHFANEALKKFGDNYEKALEVFDQAFAGFYAGRRMRTVSDYLAVRDADWKERGLMVDINNYDITGQRDFKSKFKEKSGKGDFLEDQTHHFTAYFSWAINNGTNIAKVHQLLDNHPDAMLGKAGEILGKRLRRDPQLLKQIGAIIGEGICFP
jgi:YD repeat-containing protein